MNILRVFGDRDSLMDWLRNRVLVTLDVRVSYAEQSITLGDVRITGVVVTDRESLFQAFACRELSYVEFDTSFRAQHRDLTQEAAEMAMNRLRERI
jgi:stalled ribosome rescue protein Dom34